MSEFSPFGAEMRDMELATTRSRINDGVASAPVRSTSARSAGSCGGFCGDWKWGQNPGRDIISAVTIPESLLPQGKIGVNPRKGASMSKKEKFPLYLSPEKKAILERRYQEDGSRSITAFIERAVDFYLDYLSANNAGLFLPTSIKSYLDGRMGQLEERLSSIAFRQAVEQDMVAGILADEYQFSGEDLRRRRAESVQNVRKTNGRVLLEQRVRGAWEEDDEWQD